MAGIPDDAFPPLPSRSNKAPRKPQQQQTGPSAAAVVAAAAVPKQKEETATATAAPQEIAPKEIRDAASPPEQAAKAPLVPEVPLSEENGAVEVQGNSSGAASWLSQPSSPPEPSPVAEEGELDASVLNALKTAKERNFLLKLESHIINNLQSNKIERIKLTTPIPPFLRFLVHLVAKYFGLDRSVDQNPGEKQKATMTLLRTEHTRIPARTLHAICAEMDNEDRAPTVQLQRKPSDSPPPEGCREEGGEVVHSMPMPSMLLGQPLPPGQCKGPPISVDQVQEEDAPSSATGPQSWAAVAALPDGNSSAGGADVRRVLAGPKVRFATKKEVVGLPVLEEVPATASVELVEAEGSPAEREDEATQSEDEATQSEEESEGEVVTKPAQPTLIPGKLKVMQRSNQADEVPRSSGDESEDKDNKTDPSRLPLQEREKYYLEARARIFGEEKSVPDTPEASTALLEEGKPDDPQTLQRRAAVEMKLAQERINDLHDPAYSRVVYPRARPGYGKGPMGGKGGMGMKGYPGFNIGFEAAPTDVRSMGMAGIDPNQVPLAARAAAVEAQGGMPYAAGPVGAGPRNQDMQQQQQGAMPQQAAMQQQQQAAMMAQRQQQQQQHQQQQQQQMQQMQQMQQQLQQGQQSSQSGGPNAAQLQQLQMQMQMQLQMRMQQLQMQMSNSQQMSPELVQQLQQLQMQHQMLQQQMGQKL